MRELLSTLAKEPKPQKDWENTLSVLASKVDTLNSYTPPSAETIARASLLGDQTPLTGQVPLTGGRRVRSRDGTYGVIFDEPEEKKILRDWQKKNFHDYYKKEASEIRRIDHSVDLKALQKTIAEALKNFPKFTKLAELAQWLDEVYFRDVASEYHLTVMGSDLLPPDELKNVVERWRKDKTPLVNFAPYAFYFYRVNTLYQIGLGLGLISSSKDAKSHLDIQYLYYLPFCMCFTSSDKHLLEIAEVFRRENQMIIPGARLKTDLRTMHTHFSSMPDEERTKAWELAKSYPPALPDSITGKAWETFMRPRPDPSLPIQKRSKEEEKALIERLNKDFYDSVPIDGNEPIPGAPTRPKRSILDRNKAFISGVFKIIGSSDGKQWDQIKKEFNAHHVRSIYNLHADLWHPTDPLQDLAQELVAEKKLRALYLGDIEPYDLVEQVLRWSLHFDQILIPDPFHSPWARKEEHNPIATPDEYEVDTLKLVYALALLEPLLVKAQVVFVPDPADFFPELMKLRVTLAEKKKENPIYKEITQHEGERIKRISFQMEMRFIAMSPVDRQKIYVESQIAPLMNEEEALKYFAHVRQFDPLCIDRDVIAGQMNIVRSGANYESSLLLASLYRAIPISPFSMRAQEYKLQATQMPSFVEPLATNLLATPNCKIVDPVFAIFVKEKGALAEFRDFMRQILVAHEKPDLSLDGLFEFLEEEAKTLAEMYSHGSGLEGETLVESTKIDFIWSDNRFLTDDARTYIDSYAPALRQFTPNSFLGFPVTVMPDLPFGMS